MTISDLTDLNKKIPAINMPKIIKNKAFAKLNFLNPYRPQNKDKKNIDY